MRGNWFSGIAGRERLKRFFLIGNFFLASAEFFDQFVWTKMESDNFLVNLCINCFEERQFKYQISISYLIMWINLMNN
jgi:hypothetical protein